MILCTGIPEYEKGAENRKIPRLLDSTQKTVENAIGGGAHSHCSARQRVLNLWREIHRN